MSLPRRPHRLAARRGKRINVIVETPKGSRTKYAYDAKSGLFCASKFLPRGISFPANFGFIPSTRAEDGDPLDVLIWMDEPSFPGCLLGCRVLGIVLGEQSSKGRWIRNDRLIVVPCDDKTCDQVKTLKDLDQQLVSDLERFFVVYHRNQGRKYRVVGRGGRRKARRLLKNALRA